MTQVSETADREIRMKRLMAAPRDLVFKVWTDPAHVVRWWGPRGFTTTTHGYDIRPGGFWHFTMHGPDGTDYPNYIAYREIVAPERMVYDHKASADEPAGHFVATVTFAAQGDRTLIDFCLLFPTREDRDRTAAEVGAVEGGLQTLDRLQEAMSIDAGDRSAMAISRVVKAPRDLVWKMFTEVEHLKAWFGPTGAETVAANLDLRVGGRYHYCMRASGMEMWGRWIFREIVPGERLVYTSEFSDAAGGVTRAPFGSDWPLTTLATTTFLDHPGGTLVTIEWHPVDATEAEIAVFAAAHGGMLAGWTGTFERLDAYLAHRA